MYRSRDTGSASFYGFLRVKKYFVPGGGGSDLFFNEPKRASRANLTRARSARQKTKIKRGKCPFSNLTDLFGHHIFDFGISRRVQKSSSGSAQMIGTEVPEDAPTLEGVPSGTPLPIISACSKVLIRNQRIKIRGLA